MMISMKLLLGTYPNIFLVHKKKQQKNLFFFYIAVVMLKHLSKKWIK